MLRLLIGWLEMDQCIHRSTFSDNPGPSQDADNISHPDKIVSCTRSRDLPPEICPLEKAARSFICRAPSVVISASKPSGLGIGPWPCHLKLRSAGGTGEGADTVFLS